MASMYPVCPNGHAAESSTSRFCAICGSPISAPAPQMPPAPPPPASTCPNGHPLARPNQAFCEICAAPVGIPAPALGAVPGAGYPTEAVPSPTYAPPPVAPPAYEPAPIPVGGGSRNVLGLAIGGIAVLAAAALVAFVVMSPRGGAGPTPAPTSVAAATASTPSSTAPAATPTMSPVTPTPTPTQAATPSPTPEPIVTAEPPAGSTCRGAAYGVTVTYPATWYAYAGDAERACTLFDPKPFTVSGANAQVLGAVTIFSAPDSMDKTVADYAAAGKVLQQRTTTIAGRNAAVLELDYAGVGDAPNGMREYLYAIEYGTQSLIVGTQGIADPSYATTDWPYEGYQDNLLTVDFIAQSLTFD